MHVVSAGPHAKRARTRAHAKLERCIRGHRSQPGWPRKLFHARGPSTQQAYTSANTGSRMLEFGTTATLAIVQVCCAGAVLTALPATDPASVKNAGEQACCAQRAASQLRWLFRFASSTIALFGLKVCRSAMELVTQTPFLLARVPRWPLAMWATAWLCWGVRRGRSTWLM